MGYNISTMTAILDMQISWFCNSAREFHQREFRKKLQRSDERWRLESVYGDLGYENEPMAAMFWCVGSASYPASRPLGFTNADNKSSPERPRFD